VLAFCPKRLSCSPEECCFVNCSGCGYARAEGTGGNGGS
jgi:hypothetical protein